MAQLAAGRPLITLLSNFRRRLDKVLVTEKEVEAFVPILAKSKALDEALLSFIQVVYVELLKVSFAIGKVQEVGSRQLLDEDRGPYLLLCYRFSGATKQLSMIVV